MQQPALALRFISDDSLSLARRASEALLSGNANPEVVAHARADALAALSRNATLVEAWRTLALTTPADSLAAERLLNFAQALSRRDLPTQLALIEKQVERGDIAGALHHYDVILRISSAYDSILFPILASASTEPAVRQALAAKLAIAPMWRRRFLSYLVSSATPTDQQANLFAALTAAGPLADGDIVAAQATNAALSGQYAVADRFYRIAQPDGAKRRLRNGSFDGDYRVPPYDWQLDIGETLDATIATFNGNQRLEIVSRRGDGLRAARQLVTLPVGRLRLVARYGVIDGVAPAMPRISLKCVPGDATIAAFESADNGTLGGNVVVPPACRWQWLEIGVRQESSGTTVGTWIDDVTFGAPQRQ